jgi:hypothetical protein
MTTPSTSTAHAGAPSRTMSHSIPLAAPSRTPLAANAWRLSVLIPVFNELNTIGPLLDRVHATPVPKEIICVDD